MLGKLFRSVHNDGVALSLASPFSSDETKGPPIRPVETGTDLMSFCVDISASGSAWLSVASGLHGVSCRGGERDRVQASRTMFGKLG